MERFLEGFHQRMAVVGIVESIVNRRGRNTEIEQLFEPHGLTNLVFSVLLFIMEKTLAEDKECDKVMISQFVDRLCLAHYGLVLKEDTAEIVTEYILKTILQNDGEPYYFNAINYEQEKPVKLPIRLIEDHLRKTVDGYRLTYTLSDQGYDFLFRTKEVDQELQFNMEELRLRELLKRKNFSRASEQSDSLIQMIRQKKREVQGLLLRIKEDIDNIDVEEQERLVNSIYDMLQNEYEIMEELDDQVERAEKQIYKDYQARASLDHELIKAQADLHHIKGNLRIIISEQRDLLLNRKTLTELYIQTLEDTFAYQNEKRFDFEEVILRGMEEHPEAVKRFWQLLNPLFLTNANRHLNLQRVFARQGMMKTEEEEEAKNLLTEELAEDVEEKKAQLYQSRYREIVGGLIRFVRTSGGCIRFSEWLKKLKQESDMYDRFMEERLLFTTVLRLYDLHEMNLHDLWEEEDRMVDRLTDEFDPALCFLQLRSDDKSMERIRFMKVEKIDDRIMEGEWSFDQGEMKTVERMTITDFQIRVEWDDE